jgi:hypothetical protein
MENPRKESSGKLKEGNTQRKMDGWMDGVRWSMADRGVTEEGTRDRDV